MEIKMSEAELFNKTVGYISKYPVVKNYIIQLLNVGILFEKIEQTTNKMTFQKVSKTKYSPEMEEKCIKSYFEFIDRIENRIKMKERKIDFEFPTYYFDSDKVMKHSKLLSKDDRYEYLNYVLKEYPGHIERRYNALIHELNSVLINDNLNFIGLFRIIMNNKGDLDTEKLQLLSLPMIPRTLPEIIHNELNYLRNEKLSEIGTNDSPKISSSLDEALLKKLTEILIKNSKMDVDTSSESAVEESNRENRNSNKTQAKSLEDERYLSTKQVEKIFNISRITLYRWRLKEIIDYTKINNRNYYKYDDIKALTESKKKFRDGYVG